MWTQVCFRRRWRIELRSRSLIMQLIFQPIKLFINFYFTDSGKSTFRQQKVQSTPMRSWYHNWFYLGRSPALSVARNRGAGVHSHVFLWLFPSSFWQSRTQLELAHVGQAGCLCLLPAVRSSVCAGIPPDAPSWLFPQSQLRWVVKPFTFFCGQG